MSGKGTLAAALAACLLLAASAWAAPSEDRILALDQYTTDKGRRLATAHGRALRALNAEIYHCMPWVEVQKSSIGFFRPKHIASDSRYLSVRIYVEQDPSPAFAALRVEERASAMFSRYVGALLRRMNEDAALAGDPALDGYTVILEWLKQMPRAQGERPVHETIAVFVDKALALEYLGRRRSITDVAAHAKVRGFDGEAGLGDLRLAAWDDNFVSTYKVANYQVEAGVTCR
ncbi:MAG: hypothetical protein A3E31_17880 [Candidatus Rokubacteria bacterium RIFCSPHIGHO2_12_FULL_73_22]|nr:MAG: hypothetical protein A3D33_07850 [Candidatus Rokubacteria bacterium RIFCSPHIGHO2_02_FULL_73_26]OGK99308.1 MAG: hypothetical protein A3E31_17880 [Candidatus Rokubacteria bacterium RIFCSPHIGHO2_12_FULL_73_22]OGL11273.1 MAG: hypothetical protein A3I14_15305 [Candidatus Rokubacteria bacterium RIFCSPLOWO2_02_FULL_73_56]OGL24262.1 MAG: hypothetical protein A3G44_10425 [Candidatus Rokubacteria bacterium RIFCSPLOWO2_12_FULL_73_47]